MEYKRTTKYTLSVIFLFMLILSFNTFAQLKVGLINTAMIMQNYSEMVEVQKQIEELQQKHSKELKDMENELKTKSKRFESQSLLLSEERKEQMRQELEDLYRKGLKYQQDVGGRIQEKYKELSDPVIERINEMIDKVASIDKFDLVFDIVNMGVLYANPEKTEDITQRVLDELNKAVEKSKTQN